MDSHAHLQTKAFTDDGDEVLAEAIAAGVERVLVPGFDLPSVRAGLVYARRHGLKTSAGIHPHEAAGADDGVWAEIVATSADDDVAAIGETGLDYDRGYSPPAVQLANMRRHLELALTTAKPLILHCRSKPGRRDAQDDLLAELRSAGGGGAWRAAFGDRPPAVLHSFSGPVDYAEAALDLGLAISFSGLVFRGGEEPSADVARIVPADRLLTETDAPFLKPRGVRHRRNVPANVAITAEWVREQRGDDPEAFGDALVAAFDRFIGVDR